LSVIKKITHTEKNSQPHLRKKFQKNRYRKNYLPEYSTSHHNNASPQFFPHVRQQQALRYSSRTDRKNTEHAGVSQYLLPALSINPIFTTSLAISSTRPLEVSKKSASSSFENARVISANRAVWIIRHSGTGRNGCLMHCLASQIHHS